MDISVNAYKKSKPLDRFRDKIGKHFNIHTEQDYVSWIKLFSFTANSIFWLWVSKKPKRFSRLAVIR
jgi:hypothetical protein